MLKDQMNATRSNSLDPLQYLLIAMNHAHHLLLRLSLQLMLIAMNDPAHMITSVKLMPGLPLQTIAMSNAGSPL